MMQASSPATAEAEHETEAGPVAFAIEAHGVPIGLRTNRAELCEPMLQHCPPGHRRVATGSAQRCYELEAIADEAAGQRYRLTEEANLLVETAALEEALENLESDLQLFVAEMAADRVFVHAGVVQIGGRALVLPGRSYSGKSTLVQALVRAGAIYSSDEYAVLDSQGLAHPYPRRLSLREGGRWRRRRTAVELGSRSADGPAPVGRVLFAQYDPEGRWQPERLSPGKALLGLINHTVSIRRQPAAALAALQRVAATAVAQTGLRGDADEFAQQLMDEMKLAL
jgi:hypothetical protein